MNILDFSLFRKRSPSIADTILLSDLDSNKSIFKKSSLFGLGYVYRGSVDTKSVALKLTESMSEMK